MNCKPRVKELPPPLQSYSGDGLLSHASNINFGFLQIKWEPMKIKKQMIPHLNALIMDIKIPDKEGRGVIRGLPRPLFVKSVLFRKKGRGKSLMLPRPCPSRILLSTTIAKKWHIVGLCNICSNIVFLAGSLAPRSRRQTRRQDEEKVIVFLPLKLWSRSKINFCHFSLAWVI